MEAQEKPPMESPYPREARFFGLCPLVFCDTVYQIIDDYLADAVDAIENEFRASCKEKGIALDGTKSEALKECLEEFLDRLRHVSDRNVDTFELYVLKNIFRVPKDLPLTPAPTADQDAVTTPMEVDGPSPPDASTTSAGMSQAPTAADEEALDQELSQLRSRLRKVRRQGQTATVKQKELESVLKQAQSGLYHLQLIEQDLASAADEPLTESIRAYIQQQAQLIALCKDSEGLAELLRKRFQNRRSTVDGNGEGSASMAREDDDAPATNGSGGPELDSPTHGPMDEPLRFQDIKTRSAADVSQLRQLLNG